MRFSHLKMNSVVLLPSAQLQTRSRFFSPSEKRGLVWISNFQTVDSSAPRSSAFFSSQPYFPPFFSLCWPLRRLISANLESNDKMGDVKRCLKRCSSRFLKLHSSQNSKRKNEFFEETTRFHFSFLLRVQ